MPGNCHKASEMDLAALLTEPQSPEWAEFQEHALRCESCAAEVSRWTQLEYRLRSMGQDIVTTHPSEKLLAQFHRRRESLSATDQDSIGRHLQICPACREELSLLTSFNFSLLQKWVDEEKPAHAVMAKQPTLRESLVARLLEVLRSLVFHPAFAYGVALLLGIRVASHELLPHSSSGPDFVISPPAVAMRAGSERSVSPGSSAIVVPSSLPPPEAALALLEAYKTACEARDMSALDRLWKMSGEWHTTMAQLFEESRRLSLLFDIQAVRVNDEEHRVSVEFAQVTTVLSKEGRFYTKGPVSYIADIRRRDGSSGWEIQNLQHVSD